MLKNKLLRFPPQKEYEYAIHCLAKLMLLLADIQYYFECPRKYDAGAPEWFIRQIKDAYHSLPDAAVEIVGKLQDYKTLKDRALRLQKALETAAAINNSFKKFINGLIDGIEKELHQDGYCRLVIDFETLQSFKRIINEGEYNNVGTGDCQIKHRDGAEQN